jgi:hypothetical protein
MGALVFINRIEVTTDQCAADWNNGKHETRLCKC